MKNFSESLRFSLQALQANKVRTFLTGLGLVIGNASVILVVTIVMAGGRRSMMFSGWGNGIGKVSTFWPIL